VQYIESSIIGIRSAVITLKRRSTPLRFILFPMVHVAEPAFYLEVENRAGACDLIVAEGTPSADDFWLQKWVSKIRVDRLVDQLTALDLERTGVRVQWEDAPRRKPKSGREQAITTATDFADAVLMKALGRFGTPLGLPSLDQSDEHDDRWERLANAGRIGRAFETKILHERDSQLVQALGAIHRERHGEQATVAVVYGAAHIPAVVDYLTQTYRYYLENSEWLTVVHESP
jgi:hypothetical protein